MSNSSLSQRLNPDLEALIAVVAAGAAATAVAFGAAALSPLAVLVAVVAIAAIVGVRLAPVTAIIAITAVRGMADALNGVAGISIGGVALDPVDAVTVAFSFGAMWWLIVKIREGAHPGRAALVMPAFVFAALAGVSLLHSSGFFFGLADLAKLTPVFLAYLVLVVERPPKERLLLLLGAVVVGSLVPMLVGLLHLLQGTGMNFEGQAGLRIQSVFSHPNTYGLYLVAVVVAAWGYGRESHGWRRYLTFAIGVGAMASLILPLSRSAWLAMAMVVLSIGWRYPKVFLYVAIGVIVAVMVQPRLVERALDLSGSDVFESSNSVDIRVDMWSEAIRLWEVNPVLGAGWGSFAASTGGGFVHNDYIRTLVELGPLGAFVFVALMALLLRSSYRAMRGRRDMPVAFFGYAVGYVLVAGLTNAFIKSPYQWYFWVLAGVAFVWGNATGYETEPTRTPDSA